MAVNYTYNGKPFPKEALARWRETLDFFEARAEKELPDTYLTLLKAGYIPLEINEHPDERLDADIVPSEIDTVSMWEIHARIPAYLVHIESKENQGFEWLPGGEMDRLGQELINSKQGFRARVLCELYWLYAQQEENEEWALPILTGLDDLLRRGDVRQRVLEGIKDARGLTSVPASEEKQEDIIVETILHAAGNGGDRDGKANYIRQCLHGEPSPEALIQEAFKPLWKPYAAFQRRIQQFGKQAQEKLDAEALAMLPKAELEAALCKRARGITTPMVRHMTEALHGAAHDQQASPQQRRDAYAKWKMLEATLTLRERVTQGEGIFSVTLEAAVLEAVIDGKTAMELAVEKENYAVAAMIKKVIENRAGTVAHSNAR